MSLRNICRIKSRIKIPGCLKLSFFTMKSSLIITLMVVLLFLVSCGGQAMKTATFETSMGTFTIELSDKTPITTSNFVDLASKGFYDGTKFHRIIPDFMLQGGDPLSKNNALKSRWGTGGPGYEIKDEFDPSLRNVRGTIAMANHGPNTGGSQFFINVVYSELMVLLSYVIFLSFPSPSPHTYSILSAHQFSSMKSAKIQNR